MQPKSGQKRAYHPANADRVGRAKQAVEPPALPPERAVIVAVSWDHQTPYLPPRELLPLGPKTVITHVLDEAAEAGVQQAEIIVGDFADELAAFVGDGSRWGLSVSYHVVADARRPHEAVLQIASETIADSARPILLLNTERLRLPTGDGPVDPTLGRFCVHVNRERQLAAATVPRHFLIEFEAESLSYNDWQRRIVALADLIEGAVHTGDSLSLATPGEFVSAQQTYFSAAAVNNPDAVGHVEQEVWVGPGTSVHPSAQLIAPVYVGASAEISAGAIVGPNVTLAADTIVGRGSHVENSVVAAGSQVGDRLHVRDSFIAGGAVYHTLHRAGVPLSSRLLIADVAASKLVALLAWWHDACFALSTVFAAPLVCAAGWVVTCVSPAEGSRTRGSAIHHRQHFWTHVFPRLARVLAGNARLFGASSSVTPNEQAVEERPLRHQANQVGLISEALVRFGPHYTRRQGLSVDMDQVLGKRTIDRNRLWIRYLRCLISTADCYRESIAPSSRPTGSHRGYREVRQPKLVRIYASFEGED